MAERRGATRTRPDLVLCAVFFASGASALLFETLWFRLTGLMLGNSVWASSMVLSSFMAGLALGNALAGRFGPGFAAPLRVYAMLEIGIGFSGLALVVVLPSLTRVFAPVFGPFLDRPWILNPLRLGIAGALMVIPTTAMGATLPLLVRAIAREDQSFGSVLGRLYGWNTLGAVAGALAGEMVLIEALGLRGTGLAAATLNLLAGAIAIAIGRAVGPLAASSHRPARMHRQAWLLATAAFVAGGTLLALEVVWSRFLLLFSSGTSLSFALMLAVVLLGIAGGGLFAAGLFRVDPNAERWTAAASLLSGVALVVSFAGFSAGPAAERMSSAIFLRDAAASLRLMLVTSLGSGMLFTFIGRAIQRRIAEETRATSVLTLANTVGAALGALAGGFVLLPNLGIERSLLVLACCYGLIAIVVILAGTVTPARGERVVLGLSGTLLIASLVFFPFGLLRNEFVPLITAPFRTDGSRIIGIREGLTETAIYLRKDLWGEPYDYRLMTNGISMSGTTLLAQRYMSLFADLPMALHPAATRALLISYGVGTTAKALTETAGLESIDVVDISRDVIEMSRLRSFQGGHPLDDPRVRLHIEDGRFFLLTSPLRFDLITAEPPPPKEAGIVNLYSREYFELIRGRLNDGGLVTYWLPIYQLLASEGKAITKAFCSTFEDCSLWSGGAGELILMGSRRAGRPDIDSFSSRWRDPRTARRLSAIGVEAPELLGTLFIADAPWLRRFTEGVAPLVDNYPLRLSPRPVAELPADFEPLFDVRASQRRFAASAWVASVWPPEIRRKTIESFVYRNILDAFFLRSQRPGDFSLLDEAGYVIRSSPYQAIPLILLRSNARQQEIAETARRRGEADPLLTWALGVRALSERRFTDAAALLGDASRRSPRNTQFRRDAAFAELLSRDAGRSTAELRPPDRAAAVSRQARPRIP